MQTHDAPTNLGLAVAEAESDLLFGRGRELEALRQRLEASRHNPTVTYVHGPAGTGKSALLRAVRRSAAAAGMCVAVLDAVGSLRGPEMLLRALAQVLPGEAGGTGRTPAQVMAGINELARQRGVLLIVDHYEDLVAWDSWLRHEILYQCGPGVAVLLAGRRTPDEGWPGDRPWRSVLQPLPVAPFTPEQATAFLEHCGVLEPSLQREALHLAGTSPALLAVVADAVVRLSECGRGDVGQADEVARWSALVEQMLHPGSRRSAWRAGVGSCAMDRVLAAASLLPSFDRDVLVSMLGAATVDAGWSQVMALRLVYPWQGHHRLHDTVREALRAIVLRQRPWAQGRWRQQAFTHCLTGCRTAGAFEHEIALALALHASPVGYRLDAPCETRMSMGATLRDRQEIREQPEAPFTPRLVEAHPDCFLVLRAADGTLAGYSAALPLTADLPSLLGEQSARLPAEARTHAQDSLIVCLLRVLSPQGGVREALWRHLLLQMANSGRVVSLVQDPATVTLLTALGFRWEHDDTHGPGRHVLDLCACGGWSGWLRQLARPFPEELVPAWGRRDAARDALVALHDDQRLSRTAAARHFAVQNGQTPAPGRVRAWLLDALQSADLGSTSMPGRELLVHYYLNRTGSHETVADELGASRATYFRWHRVALERFADALFG